MASSGKPNSRRCTPVSSVLIPADDALARSHAAVFTQNRFMKRKGIQSLFLGCVFLCIATSGCIHQPIKPQQSQLQMRQFQTREYPQRDQKAVMKALLNVLQDEGFIVKNADRELGFIAASKEIDVTDSSEALFAALFQGAAARYKKSSIIESSVNVSEFGKESRVRVIFQLKVLDNFGVPIEVKQVDEASYYQDFFAKVDKGLFIERQSL